MAVTLTLAVVATLAPAWTAVVAAHPGHGTMALVGTLVAADADAIILDVRDVASGTVTRMRVEVDARTKLRVRKETITSLTPWLGAPVVATVDYEEGADGRTVYHATKVQVTPPKTKRG